MGLSLVKVDHASVSLDGRPGDLVVAVDVLGTKRLSQNLTGGNAESLILGVVDLSAAIAGGAHQTRIRW